MMPTMSETTSPPSSGVNGLPNTRKMPRLAAASPTISTDTRPSLAQ